MKAITKREREVLVLTCTGYSNKRIAAKLGISIKTAINIRALVYNKLNVHCVADLVRAVLVKKIMTIGDLKQGKS